MLLSKLICTFTISVGLLLPILSSAQTNPYRLAEAPNPPPHLNDGRWGEMIQVRVGLKKMFMFIIAVSKWC